MWNEECIGHGAVRQHNSGDGLTRSILRGGQEPRIIAVYGEVCSHWASTLYALLQERKAKALHVADRAGGGCDEEESLVGQAGRKNEEGGVRAAGIGCIVVDHSRPLSGSPRGAQPEATNWGEADDPSFHIWA